MRLLRSSRSRQGGLGQQKPQARSQVLEPPARGEAPVFRGERQVDLRDHGRGFIALPGVIDLLLAHDPEGQAGAPARYAHDGPGDAQAQGNR